MNPYFINTFINSTALNLGTSYAFFKISNYTKKLTVPTKIVILLASILLILIQSSFKNTIPTIYRIALIFICYSLLFKSITKTNLSYSILITSVSSTISYVCNFIASMITASIFLDIFNIYNENKIYDINEITPVIFHSLLNLLFVFLFFRIKRFKNGFPFLKKYNDNEYFNIFLLIISTIILFAYFSYAEFSHVPLGFLLIGFLFFVLIMAILLQRTFILYQKQKLQLQTLKDYEQELSETKQKLETAIQEKDKIVKSNHEFYHRQEALNKKLDALMQQQAISMNTEFGEEYSNILDRLKTLSNEYSTKTASTPILDKTNIPEIDDMLSYMQSECTENHIEFILKIDCDVHYMITNFISKSQLETLLGDLIRNAIIAINHSSDSYKSIMVVFGIKDDSYELCVLDSGIPFEIDTLINLGLKPSSTHLDDGGTGIGFITTFETINSCNASFIINEITNNNYTKSLEIKFDNKNEYIIISDRKDKIEEMKHSDRKIILR